MADDGATAQRASPTVGNDKGGLFSTWQRAVAALTIAFGLATVAYQFGRTTGIDAGGEKYQAQINELRDNFSKQTSAATISEARLKDAQDQIGKWRESYASLNASAQQIAADNVTLKEQLKQLDPCAFMERQIESIELTMNGSWPGQREALAERRDKIQDQLSTCKH